MSVLDFIDSNVFSPVYQNDIPLIQSDNVEEICRELSFAIKNNEQIFIYGDYDMDGFCSVMVWKEVLSLMRAPAPAVFKYISRTHTLDRDILRQVEQSKARVVIICDTGSGVDDKHVLSMLQMKGYTTIVLDHHVFAGDYKVECANRLTFNSYEERGCLGGAEASGAYTSLLVAKVLCEKYMNCPLSYNAKVYALGSMYSDCVDMSTPIGRGLYNAVAVTKASGPVFLTQLNKWGYLYGRRFFSYIVAPKINGCFRAEALDILNRAFDVSDKYQMQKIADDLQEVHSSAKSLVTALVPKFVRTRIGDIVLCVHTLSEETQSMHIRNYTGIIATRIADEERAAVVAVVKDGNYYSGSFRDYYGRELLGALRLFSDCAGHPAAFKVGFWSLDDFKRHLSHLSLQLSSAYSKPYMILNSSVIDGDVDLDALALYNEYMNTKKFVIISHKCFNVKCTRSTQYNRYYHIGLPTQRLLMTKNSLVDGSTVLIEPAICRGVELREME